MAIDMLIDFASRNKNKNAPRKNNGLEIINSNRKISQEPMLGLITQQKPINRLIKSVNSFKRLPV